VKFAVEPLFPDLIEEVKPLWDEQYEELSNVKGLIPLDPDIEQFQAIEDEDILTVVTVRKEGKLVGYFFLLIYPSLHFKGVLTASADLYHVTKDERGSGIGKALFEYAINICKDKDVKRMLVGEKTESPHSKLIESFGFTRIEQFYHKVLK
jgi:L-amino acid N-acyltransferase YncA